MNIEYFNPFSKAWDRMKKALFQPFNLGKWFVLGFAVFLAQLMNGGGGGGGGNIRGSSNGDNTIHLPDIQRFPEMAAEWIVAHMVLAIIISIAILIIIGIFIVLTWLSARGTFIFLDNVVHDRALIAKPWREYKVLSNSLFFWHIGFGLITFIFVLPLLVLGFFLIVQLSRGYSGPDTILGIIITGLVFLAGAVLIAYISLFTTSFVVPIMYKHNLRILEAWQKFLPILKSHWLYFILYGLFLLLLYIGIGAACILAGCLTCCIGFIILMVPYINCVILLPVYYTFRAFSLEFLAQWGPDYSLFPDEPIPSEDNPPPPPAPPPIGPPPDPPKDPPAGVTIIGM